MQEKGKERFVKEGRMTEQNPPWPHRSEPSSQVLVLHSCSMERVSKLLKMSETRQWCYSVNAGGKYLVYVSIEKNAVQTVT